MPSSADLFSDRSDLGVRKDIRRRKETETMSDDGWHRQKVEIVLKKDSDLYRRIEKYAAHRGVPIEAVVDSLISVGSYNAMETNLNGLEKLTTRKR